jgi:hypothetical protein
MPLAMAGVCAQSCEASGMKKYIRNMLEDLKKKHDEKDPLPPVVSQVVPQDLENQDLSSNPEERVRQLDQQAQDDEVRETLE